MFASSTFAVLLASSSVLLARAEVTPNEPGPGDSFNQGSTCHIAWVGDTNTTTAALWKSMNIELMSGSNLGMVHLTTVATNQDGSVDGKFDYNCPEVTPNSAIYFYQFTSALTANTDTQWTTRFTIAAADGTSEDPANKTQPSGDAIPWGLGTLTDPSTAVAAPVYGSGSAPSGSASSTGTGTSSSGTVGQTTTSSKLVTSTVSVPTTSSEVTKLSTSSAAATSGSNNQATTSSNSAGKALGVKGSVLGAAGVLGASAVVFAVWL